MDLMMWVCICNHMSVSVAFFLMRHWYICVCVCSHVWFCVTPWTAACQALLSMGFSRQENWNGLPFPAPGDLPTQGSNPCLFHFPHWQVDFLPLSNLGSHTGTYILIQPHWYIYLSGPNSLFHWHRKFLFCPNESVDQRIGMSKDMCKLLWRREVSSLNQDKLHCICTVLWREQGLCSWTHMDSTPPVSNY